MNSQQRQKILRSRCVLGVAVALLAACSSRGGAAGVATDISGSTRTTPAGSSTLAPLTLQPSGVSLDPLVPQGTATPRIAHPDSGARPNPRAAIGTVYESFMTDLSGLYDNLSQVWVTAISEVTTPALTTAARRSAVAIQRAHDHGVGTLVDSHRVIEIHGSSATLVDCLDEVHWYVVEDAGGKPDPSVTRGYFVGSATFVEEGGQWYASSWNSHPQRCTF